LLALLDGSEETGFIYPVNIPSFGSGVQDGAAPLRNGLLEWLGVTGDNSLWGSGVKIAILDTGIADHIAFRNAIERINLVALPTDLADLNGHGTAVATLIFSNNPIAPGIAPGATPLSIRIADDSGGSNSFLIAQGIIAAVDAGAQIINISLGGSGQSSLVESALAYARQAGAVVVAAAGNSGTQGVMQPAASPSVIAVGAVDAKNQHMAFSTTGSEIAVSAPGFEVNVAYPGDKAAVVSGTSFSSPIVAGTIAATMSNSSSQKLSAAQAASVMNANLNDVGVQGSDSSTGAGVPDMWRILNGNTPGIYDAAVTSISTATSKQGSQVQVLVQNLGTETMVNAAVSVNINGSATRANITTLAPGDTRVVTIPVGSIEGLNIQGSVQLSGSQTDRRPSNDSISQISPVANP
jgi:subtilisin family serine protease